MKTRATTAELVAAMRALHQRDRVRLVEDPHALGLCGWHLRLLARLRPISWFLINHALRDLRPSMLGVLIRARYAEQALEAAIRDGIAQYVIIGAGLDSFALRRADLMRRLQVFEIDLPAMQALKRERLRRMGVEPPPGLHFVAADLGEVPVMEALATSSFDAGLPAFLSLLGVTYYLPTEVIAATARSISQGVAPGSRFVLDHMLDDATAGPEHREKRAALKAYVAKRGEPMHSDYSPEEMSELMAEAGFRTLERITMMDLGERFTRELGPLPFEIPGIFACGLYEA